MSNHYSNYVYVLNTGGREFAQNFNYDESDPEFHTKTDVQRKFDGIN